MFEINGEIKWGPFALSGNCNNNDTEEKAYIREVNKIYIETIGAARYGDASDLYVLTGLIYNYFYDEKKQFKIELKDEVPVILDLIDKIDINRHDKLHPFEVACLFNLNVIKKKLKKENK